MKTAIIDNETIYRDEKGYFLYENHATERGVYAITVRLGRTGKEVHEALSDMNDWNYRAWHGEMSEIMKACQQADALPGV